MLSSLSFIPLNPLPRPPPLPFPLLCSVAKPTPGTLSSVSTRLQSELPLLFNSSNADYSLYSSSVTFEDPLNKFSGAKRYASNINFLKNSPVFSHTSFTLHDTRIISDDTVRTRWTLQLTANLPWKPQLVFTGQSDYVVDSSGLVIKHLDYWDSLHDSTFFSFGGLMDLLALCKPGRVSTRDCSGFDVLRRTDVLQVRRFKGNGVSLRKVSDSEWRMVDNGADCIVQMVATKSVRNGRGNEEERAIRDYLKSVSFARAAQRAFVVALPVGERIVREVWVELADVSVAVDGY